MSSNYSIGSLDSELFPMQENAPLDYYSLGDPLNFEFEVNAAA